MISFISPITQNLIWGYWSFNFGKIFLIKSLHAKKLGKSYSELTEADKKEATTYGISFHSIRHLYITEQAELHGKDNAQMLAGHTNLKTTEGYVHSDQYEITKQLRQQQPN